MQGALAPAGRMTYESSECCAYRQLPEGATHPKQIQANRYRGRLRRISTRKGNFRASPAAGSRRTAPAPRRRALAGRPGSYRLGLFDPGCGAQALAQIERESEEHRQRQKTEEDRSEQERSLARIVGIATGRARQRRAAWKEHDRGRECPPRASHHRYTFQYRTGQTPTTKNQNTRAAANVPRSSLPHVSRNSTNPSRHSAHTACSACAPMIK